MIRINLLPVSDVRKRQEGRLQLVAFAGILLVELAVLGLLYFNATNEADKIDREIKDTKVAVAKLKDEVKDAAELKKQADTLSKQLEVLAQLESQRTGPVRVLDELQAILSPPPNDEARYKQLQLNWNVEWDPRHLWLSSLVESSAGSFKMTGGAVNADDVAEFLQRLTTSNHFKDIQLDVVTAKEGQAETESGAKRRVRYVDFKIEGRLDYAGAAAPAATPGKKG